MAAAGIASAATSKANGNYADGKKNVTIFLQLHKGQCPKVTFDAKL